MPKISDFMELLSGRETVMRAVFGVLLVGLTIFVLWVGLWAFVLFVALVAVLMLREWMGIVRNFAPARPVRTTVGILLIILCVLSVLFIDVRYGVVPMIWALALVWATDIGAYVVGRQFGGPKFAPTISPNKTWSGVFGGVASAVLMSAIWWAIDSRGLPAGTIWTQLAITVGASVAAIYGDLFESHSKRLANVKDAGTLIPGHGGVLDRLDGALLALPFVAASLQLGNLMDHWL